MTPIQVEVLERLLKQSNYNCDKRRKLINGFRWGFDLGYRGPEKQQDLSDNIPFSEGVGSPTELWNKIMKEVKLHRYAGLFKNPPFKHFVQSPVGLVPKANNKTRLIFHLSFDFDGDNEDRKSINFHTPKEMCRVKYNIWIMLC